MVETEGVQSAGIIGSDFEKDTVAQTPLGRLGQVDDIASVATFLASNDAKWITGELLRRRWRSPLIIPSACCRCVTAQQAEPLFPE